MRALLRTGVAAAAVVAAAVTLAAAPAAAATPRAQDLAAAASPGSPPPGLGIRLAEAPLSRRDDPRARIAVVDFVHPGATFSRRFEVTNGTSAPMDVLVYARPALIRDGVFSVDDRDSGEIADWVTFDRTSVRVPAEGRVPVTAYFRVPAGAAAGERYGALVVELPPPPGTTGVAVASRVAIRVYLGVGLGGEPRSDFTVTSLTASRGPDGTPTVRARVRNTGGRALDIGGTLRLDHGPGGLSFGPAPARVGSTLAPGQSSDVTVVLDRAIPAGPWHARIDLESGLLKRSADGTITFPAAAGSSAPAVPAHNLPLTRNRPFLLWVAGALALLLLVALLLLLWRRRRDRADRDRDREDREGDGPSGHADVPPQRSPGSQGVGVRQ